MVNLYDYSIQSTCRQLKCDDLLFVEYRCTPGTQKTGIWSPYGHIAYLANGSKTWITLDGTFNVEKGQALYCKKGGHYVLDSLEQDVCVLLFFIPDDMIREIILEINQPNARKDYLKESDRHIIPLQVDLSLQTFFDSVMSYFFVNNEPSPHLVKIKFKELILQILTGNHNHNLSNYFYSLLNTEKINLKSIMYENFLFNLSLDDYAQLCHRSLSTFKRDFRNAFGTSPGKWLNKKRLEYARARLMNTEESINELAFQSGFDTTSHFIKCFKSKYGYSPLRYKNQISQQEIN